MADLWAEFDAGAKRKPAADDLWAEFDAPAPAAAAPVPGTTVPELGALTPEPRPAVPNAPVAEPEPLPVDDAFLESAKSGITRWLAGNVQGAVESVQAPFQALADGPLGELVAPVVAAPQPLVDAAVDAQDLAAQQGDLGRLGAIQPKSTGEFIEQAIADPEGAARLLLSIGGESAPGILGAMLTRNPRGALGVVGASAGGTEYGGARAEGLPQQDALRSAVTAALLETAGSKATFDEVLGGASGLGRRLVRAPLLEAGGEAGTGGAQGAAQIVEGRSTPDQAALDAVLSGIVGLPGGAVEAVLGRGQTPAPPAAPPPVVPTPERAGPEPAAPPPAAPDPELDELLVRNVLGDDVAAELGLDEATVGEALAELGAEPAPPNATAPAAPDSVPAVAADAPVGAVAPVAGVPAQTYGSGLFARMGDRMVQVESPEDASAKFLALKDATDIGGMGVVELVDGVTGQPVGYIGQDGSVYDQPFAQGRLASAEPAYVPPSKAKATPARRAEMDAFLRGERDTPPSGEALEPPKKTAGPAPAEGIVIREKATGRAVMETRDPAKVAALNTDRYEAVPVRQHLEELNDPASLARQAATNPAAAPATPQLPQTTAPAVQSLPPPTAPAVGEGALAPMDAGQVYINQRDNLRVARVGEGEYLLSPVKGEGRRRRVGRAEAEAALAAPASVFAQPETPTPQPTPDDDAPPAPLNIRYGQPRTPPRPGALEDTEAAEIDPADLSPAERAAFERQTIDRTAIARQVSEQQGEQDADAKGLRAAVERAIPGAQVPVKFVRDLNGLPKDVATRLQARMTARGGTRTAGLYVPGDQPRVYVLTSVASTAEAAAFTAAHEIAGHDGLRKLTGDGLSAALETALQNPTVAAVAESMTRQRKLAPESRLLAAEEALADLAGAVRTGNWSRLEAKHGVKVPLGMRSRVVAAIENFVRRLVALFRKQGVGFSDAQVRSLLENAWQAARGEGRSGGGVAEATDTLDGMSRPEVVAAAKGLGLPATGKTADIANLVRIAQADPRSWSRGDFDAILPHLSVHQDFRQAEGSVEAILSEGLRKGMVDPARALEPGSEQWSWAKQHRGGSVFVFISGGLKYLGAQNPRLAPGNIPLFHAITEKGGSLFDAIKAGNITTRRTPLESVETAEPDVREADKLAEAAARFFGITKDPREAGYILSDGRMLDFSGRHYSEDHRSLKGARNVDHRELTGEGNNGVGLDDMLGAGSGTDKMIKFMSVSGAMRVDFNAGVASVVGEPTAQQIDVLANNMRGDYAAISIEDSKGDEIRGVEIDRPTPAKVRRFFANPNAGILESVEFTAAQTEALAKAGLPVDNRNTLQRARDRIKDEYTKLREAARDSDALKQAVFDRFHGLRMASAPLALDPEKDPYIAARQTAGIASQIEALMLYGAPKWDGGAAIIDPSTKGLLEALAPVKANINEWLGWMVGRRAQVLARQGRENNLSEADINALLSLANGREAAFQQAAKDYLAIKNAVLDYAQEAGLIDPTARAAWDHAEYIPFYRQENDKAIGPGTQRGLAGQTSGIRTLKGGENALADPLANVIRNFTRLVDSANKNRATLLAVDQLGSALFQKAPQEFRPELVPMSQVEKTLRDQGVPEATLAAMPKSALRGVQSMLSMKPPSGDDVVRVMRDGKAEYYTVLDPLVLRAMTAFKQPQKNLAIRPLIWFKRLLTTGVTTTAEFVAANFIRDSGSAWVISDDRFIPGWDSLRGIANTLRNDATTREMMMAGSTFLGGNFYDGNPDAAAAALRRALRTKGLTNQDIEGFMGTVARSPLMLWDKWLRLSGAVENANRRAVYDAALRAGRTKTEAAFAARDLMDFAMQGDSAFIQFFADVLPFFNARLQGLYKLGRRAGTKQGKRAIIARGGVITLASVALYAWNMMAHQEGYDELKEWDKDAYWHIAPGTDYHVRIPKPFEIGLVFATAPERALEAMRNAATSKGDRPDESFMALVRAVSGTLAFNPIPQAALPIAEQWANKRFFTGQPIENMGDERLLPEMREEWYTSDTMSALGNLTGFSPKRLEHLWNGYTAGLGGYVLDSSDWVVRKLSGAPDRPAMTLRDWPVVGRFLRGGSPAPSKYVTEFYDALEKATMIEQSIKEGMARDAAEEGTPEFGDMTDEALALAEEHADLLGEVYYSKRLKGGFGYRNVQALRKAQREMGQMRNEADEIALSRSMSAEEKRDALDKLTQRRNKLAKRMVERVRGN